MRPRPLRPVALASPALLDEEREPHRRLQHRIERQTDLTQHLVDVLRLSARLLANARTVGALMHAINGLRRPRPESVMNADELGRISTPGLFLWGDNDPYLPPEQARPWIERMPSSRLHVVPGGHAPWLEDPSGCARLITGHLAQTGYPPEGGTAYPSRPDPA